MATQFNKSPAEYIGIRDRAIAFYFDVECAEALMEYEDEKFQVLLGYEVKKSLVFGPPTQSKGPVLGRPQGEISSANFRDQGF